MKPGPKLKIGPAEQRRIMDMVRAGCSIADAAGAIGVAGRTMRYAMKRDPQFCRGVYQAKKSGKAKLIQKVTKAKPWQAAAWYLERMYGAEYGRKDRQTHEHVGAGGGPIQTENHFVLDYDQARTDLETFARGGAKANGNGNGSAHRRAAQNGNGKPVHSGDAD